MHTVDHICSFLTLSPLLCVCVCVMHLCVCISAALQRLGRENAALLERAGVDDDVRDLGTADLSNLGAASPAASPSSSQQQQLLGGDASPSEIAVEALSVVDVQQQQQQEDEEEDEPLPAEFQGLSEMLEGVADWQEKQERMRAALRRAGGWSVGGRGDLLLLLNLRTCEGSASDRLDGWRLELRQGYQSFVPAQHAVPCR